MVVTDRYLKRIVIFQVFLFIYGLTNVLVVAMSNFDCQAGDFGECEIDNVNCFPVSSFRDCKADCPNGDDEKCPAGMIECDRDPTGRSDQCGKCVSVRNQYSQCQDRKYASMCEEDPVLLGSRIRFVFQCTTTKNCLPAEMIRDGENQCFDHSDENLCQLGVNDCSPYAVCTLNYTLGTADAGRNTYGYSCRCAMFYKGDGRTCKHDPRLRVPGRCADNQFDCGDGIERDCIPIEKRNDCVSDCWGDVDEDCMTGITDTCICPTTATRTRKPTVAPLPVQPPLDRQRTAISLISATPPFLTAPHTLLVPEPDDGIPLPYTAAATTKIPLVIEQLTRPPGAMPTQPVRPIPPLITTTAIQHTKKQKGGPDKPTVATVPKIPTVLTPVDKPKPDNGRGSTVEHGLDGANSATRILTPATSALLRTEVAIVVTARTKVHKSLSEPNVPAIRSTKMTEIKMPVSTMSSTSSRIGFPSRKPLDIPTKIPPLPVNPIDPNLNVGITRRPIIPSPKITLPANVIDKPVPKPTVKKISQAICDRFQRIACNDGSECIDEFQIFDGVSDCLDESDETCEAHGLQCSSCVYRPQYKVFSCGCPAGLEPDNNRHCHVPIIRDCADEIRETPGKGSGYLTVGLPNCIKRPNKSQRLCVKAIYCDHETTGGGWTVIQRRIADGELFNRTWIDYKDGFGLIVRSMWIGNDYLAQVTGRRGEKYELLVEMYNFKNTRLTAKYDYFHVAEEDKNYALSLGRYFGSTNDNMKKCRNQPFSTVDMNNGPLADFNCAKHWESGWWFDPQCGFVGNLNVPYSPSRISGKNHMAGIIWQTLATQSRIKNSTMMIRPIGFTSQQQIGESIPKVRSEKAPTTPTTKTPPPVPAISPKTRVTARQTPATTAKLPAIPATLPDQKLGETAQFKGGSSVTKQSIVFFSVFFVLFFIFI